MFSVDRDTVSRWFDEWEKEGLKGLHDQPRSGRPAKLRIENEWHVQEIKKQLKKERQNLDKLRTELTDWLQVDVSRKTLKHF